MAAISPRHRYRPPELLLQSESPASYDQSVDLWTPGSTVTLQAFSFGMLMQAQACLWRNTPVHARCCMWLCNFWPEGSTVTIAGLQQWLDSQANASVWTQACPFKTPLCPRIYNYGRRMVVKLGTMLLSGLVGAAERG